MSYIGKYFCIGVHVHMQPFLYNIHFESVSALGTMQLDLISKKTLSGFVWYKFQDCE